MRSSHGRATFRQQTVAAFNPLADDARVQALQARLTLNSQDVAARLELAAVYEGYRLYEDATQQYRQALATAAGPLAEQAVLGLGRCTRASRRPEQAIPLLEAFSKESPSASAWNELGLLYESTGNVMTAEAARSWSRHLLFDVTLLLPWRTSNWCKNEFAIEIRGQKMKKFWTRFWIETEGQDLVEYALIVATIGLAMVAAVQGIGSALSTLYRNIADGLANFTATTPS